MEYLCLYLQKILLFIACYSYFSLAFISFSIFRKIYLPQSLKVEFLFGVFNDCFGFPLLFFYYLITQDGLVFDISTLLCNILWVLIGRFLSFKGRMYFVSLLFHAISFLDLFQFDVRRVFRKRFFHHGWVKELHRLIKLILFFWQVTIDLLISAFVSTSTKGFQVLLFCCFHFFLLTYLDVFRLFNWNLALVEMLRKLHHRLKLFILIVILIMQAWLLYLLLILISLLLNSKIIRTYINSFRQLLYHLRVVFNILRRSLAPLTVLDFYFEWRYFICQVLFWSIWTLLRLILFIHFLKEYNYIQTTSTSNPPKKDMEFQSKLLKKKYFMYLWDKL